MHEENEDDTVEAAACPYCGSTTDCKHLLLRVDKTFQDVQSGKIAEVFNKRLSELVDAHPEDYEIEERSIFAFLLDQVTALADAEAEYEFEGGPGMSSTFLCLYVSSEAQSDDVRNKVRDLRIT